MWIQVFRVAREARQARGKREELFEEQDIELRNLKSQNKGLLKALTEAIQQVTRDYAQSCRNPNLVRGVQGFQFVHIPNLYLIVVSISFLVESYKITRIINMAYLLSKISKWQLFVQTIPNLG